MDISGTNDRFKDEPLESYFERATPWAGVATDLKEAPRTTAEAMATAGLDWKVRLAPLVAQYTTEDGSKTFDIDTTANAVIRESDRSVLGIVGPTYVPVQNADAFKFFDSAIDEGLIRIETTGATRGGKKVWMLARVVGASADVVPGDVVNGYFLIANGHDGSMALHCGHTSIRVCCSNTLRLAASSEDMVRIRHTEKAVGELDRIREVVSFHRDRFNRSIEQMRQLARVDVTSEILREYVRVVFEFAEADVEKLDRMMETITPLFEHGRGNDLDGAAGTVWAALNSVTEYLSWERGNNQAARIGSLWFGEGATIGARAFREAMKIAT